MKERLGDLSVFGRDRVVATALAHWFAVEGTEPVDGAPTRGFCLHQEGRWYFLDVLDADAYAARVGSSVVPPDRERDPSVLRDAFLAFPDVVVGEVGLRFLATLTT